ncbi:MAG: ATP-binding protein [Ktedonobacteraceae bacterium]
MDMDDIIRRIDLEQRRRRSQDRHDLAVTTLPTILPPKADTGMCKKCRGAGYLRVDVPYGHPQFGKLVRCACKVAEVKEQQQHSLIALSGIMSLDRFKNSSFDTFTYSLPGLQEAYVQSWQFALQPHGWLVLTGLPGCGKTHLAVSIAKKRIEAGDTVIIQTVPDLLDHLRSAFNPAASQTYDDRFEEIKEAELLVLDDFGAQQNTTWATEKLFQLINHRYNASLPTVITSNDTHLTSIDARIKSRLCDKALVKLIKLEYARDYRIHGDEQEQEEDE